jgi:NDP-sugar pyrophosphorylase family protein
VAPNVPKILVDIAGRPFAVHQIARLKAAGFDDLVYCIGHRGDEVEAALGDGRQWGVRIRYVRDGPVPLGTGGALFRALDELGDAFLVLYGDSYLMCDYQDVVRAFSESGRLGLMTVYENKNRFDRSNVQFDAGRIVRYDKRLVTPEMHHIDYGLGVLRRDAFAGRSRGDAFDLVDIYQALVARGELAGYEVSDRFYEIGSPAGLEETRRLLETRNLDMKSMKP